MIQDSVATMSKAQLQCIRNHIALVRITEKKAF